MNQLEPPSDGFMPNPDWYCIGNDGRGDAAVLIYDNIPTKAEDFFAEINSMPAPKTIDLFVNSMGGDLFSAMAIHDRLKRFAQGGCKVRAHVEGVAASGAVLIIAAADEVTLAEDACVMLHPPVYVDGREADERLRTMAEGMARRISEGTGLGRTEVMDLLREEKWFGAAEAVSLGLAHVVIGEEGVRA